MRLRRSSILLAACLLCSIGGCSEFLWGRDKKGKVDLGVAAREGPLAKSAAYRDTIGARTYYEGMRPMRVRGYGLVVGLGKNGSRDCPRPIYGRIVPSLYKHHRFFSTVA